MTTLWTGKRIRLRVQFTDPDNPATVLVPDSATIEYKTPGGTTTTFTYPDDQPDILKDDDDSFYILIDLAEAGRWTCRAEGDEIVKDAVKASFLVRDSSL